jgi:hypothetical protein
MLVAVLAVKGLLFNCILETLKDDNLEGIICELITTLLDEDVVAVVLTTVASVNMESSFLYSDPG